MRDGRGDEEWLGLDFAPGTQVAGFLIEGRLATGSFGALYQARRGERRFAIKLVPKDERGEREVDALRRVQALPVVGFHGYGLWPDESPRFIVLALELVDGQELDVWARDFNPDAHELLVQVMRPLVDMLGQVHAAGVVHRDVKESNIVIRHQDGHPVLVDFGAAGYEGAPRLTQRLPPGTPEYRSPELLRFAREWAGEPPPDRPGDDLWALGVTFYALLTRTLPFGDRHGPLVRNILEQVPEPPHVRNPRVPRAVSDICLRMLEKAPAARYPDALAIARALEDALALADDAWGVRLFPGERRERTPEPDPPASSAPARGRRGFVALAISGALALGLALSFFRGMTPEVAPETPRMTLAARSPTPRADSRQEMAPDRMTGEVGFNAGLRKSPTPAPVATATLPPEEPMRPSPKSRSMIPALVATTCMASACVSGPRSGPPPEGPCPEGSLEAHRRYRLPDWDGLDVQLGKHRNAAGEIIPNSFPVPARNGPIDGWLIKPRGGLPFDTTFTGELIVRKEYVYGHFTRARLPDGTEFPVCLEFRENVAETIAAIGGTPDNFKVAASIVAMIRTSFSHRNKFYP